MTAGVPGTGEVEQERRSFPVAFLAGMVVVLLLGAIVYLVTLATRPQSPKAAPGLPMGPAERSYAARIQFLDLRMSRATNFLGQEFTYLYGVVANDGDRTVREIEVVMEFRDLLHQVVLRDTRKLFGPRAAPLGPGQRREFESSWDHIPQDWNQHVPSIHIKGLLLE